MSKSIMKLRPSTSESAPEPCARIRASSSADQPESAWRGSAARRLAAEPRGIAASMSKRGSSRNN